MPATHTSSVHALSSWQSRSFAHGTHPEGATPEQTPMTHTSLSVQALSSSHEPGSHEVSSIAYSASARSATGSVELNTVPPVPDAAAAASVFTQSLEPVPVTGEMIALLRFAMVIALRMEFRSSPGSLQPSGRLPLHGPSSLIGMMTRRVPAVHGKSCATIAAAGPQLSNAENVPGKEHALTSPGTVPPNDASTSPVRHENGPPGFCVMP